MPAAKKNGIDTTDMLLIGGVAAAFVLVLVLVSKANTPAEPKAGNVQYGYGASGSG